MTAKKAFILHFLSIGMLSQAVLFFYCCCYSAMHLKAQSIPEILTAAANSMAANRLRLLSYSQMMCAPLKEVS